MRIDTDEAGVVIHYSMKAPEEWVAESLAQHMKAITRGARAAGHARVTIQIEVEL